MLDDSRLKVSFAYDIDMVPSVFVADADGRELRARRRLRSRGVAGARRRTRSLSGRARRCHRLGRRLPAWRPGLRFAVGRSALRRPVARRGGEQPAARTQDRDRAADDEFEFMFDQGFTDGLPVVPPTPERVMRMLSGTRRDPQYVVAVVPPNMGEATVEKVAINAVMAGCKPEYLPVVIAALEAVCTDAVQRAWRDGDDDGREPGDGRQRADPRTHRHEHEDRRARAGQSGERDRSVARCDSPIRNIGGAKPGGTERSTLGNPMKITMCFAEWEERSPWTPLHVERGFRAGAIRSLPCSRMTERSVADRRPGRRAAPRSSPAASGCVSRRSTIRRRT